MGIEWYRSRSLRSRREEEAQARERPLGCMSGMLHLLQFRHLLLFPSHHDQHQRRPADLATITRDASLKGFRGVRAKSTSPNNAHLDRGTHHKFAILLAEAKQDSRTCSSSMRLAGKSAEAAVRVTASSEMNKEKTWLEDVVGSCQGETPRTSNVVARLMGLDELPARPDATPRRVHPSPAQVTLQLPSSPKPRQHDQKENNNGKKQQHRQGKGGCGGEDHHLPLAPLHRRRPLSSRSYNVILEMEGSRSLPGTPRMSCSGRRSCDSETPRLSLQLDTPVMEEFDYLCEVVPERQQPRSASRKPSRSSSLTKGSANKNPAPHLPDDRRTRAASSGAQQHQKDPGAGKSTGGTRSTGHENQKTRRSPPSTCCSELNGKNTPETKRVVAEAVAVYKVNVAAEQYPNPVPPSSSPFLEYRVAEGKKTSGTFAKPSTERFTEKLRRPHPEKAAGRSRTGTSKRLTGQSKIQLPSPKPEPWPSPPPRRPPVRPPAVRPLEELEKPASGLSQSFHGSTDRGRSSSRHHRPDENEEVCSHPEFRYVRMILESVGLLNRTRSGGRPAALAKWHSPSHPIDPTVFYRLELFLPDEEDELQQLGRLRHRCNRKLLFHLVEEILADILRRSLLTKPRWRSRYQAAGDMTAVVVMEKKDGGDALLRQVWSCIRRIRPAGQFRDMRDVDVLLAGTGQFRDGDAVGRLNPQHRAMGEEVESIAAVIEEAIFDSLVGELKAYC